MSASQQAGMLTYDLRSRGTSSLYEFLYQSIREDIARGRIPCGTKLPSKRNLAQHLDIGVATVTAAYDQLITEGFVRTEQRRGYFVEDVSEFRCKPVTPQVKDSSSEDGTSVGAECGAQDAAAGVFAAHGAQDARLDDASAGPNSRHRETARSSADTASDAPAAETPHAIERARDPEYFVDLKANRTSVSLFPATVWGRYMREALSLPSDNLLRSIPFNGLPELRRAIASYLRRTRGMDVSPDCIIIGAGSEYLYGRLLQMLGPTTTFAMENPGYRKFAAISKAFGNPWRPVPIDESGLLVDELEESGADVVHVSPANHFPTGIVMPIKRRLELFEWANRARKRYIIEDDYDSEFRFTLRPIPTLQSIDRAGRVIYVNTFSRTLAPSLRISYMVLPKSLTERYRAQLGFYSSTVPAMEQYTLARFLDEEYFEAHINRMRKSYRAQRDAVIDTILQSPLGEHCRVSGEDAGLHFLLTIDTKCTDHVLRADAEGRGVRLSFLSDFALRPGSAPQHTLVIHYPGIDLGRLRSALSILEALLYFRDWKYKGRK